MPACMLMVRVYMLLNHGTSQTTTSTASVEPIWSADVEAILPADDEAAAQHVAEGDFRLHGRFVAEAGGKAPAYRERVLKSMGR